MTEIIRPRRCGKTQDIYEMKKFFDKMLNPPSLICSSAPEWSEKSSEEIIEKLTSIMDRPEFKLDELKPYWTAVRLPNKEEVERLTNLRSGIQNSYNYPNPTGEVYFLGYKNTPQGQQIDMWYLPSFGRILETMIKPITIENGVFSF